MVPGGYTIESLVETTGSIDDMVSQIILDFQDQERFVVHMINLHCDRLLVLTCTV